MTDIVAQRNGNTASYSVRAALRRYWPAIAVIAFAIMLPWLFYDWSKGRHSGFVVSLISQMGLMTIFALSFNMQMGQAGLLSFGHAVFLGLGGYVTIHALNAVGDGLSLVTYGVDAAGRRNFGFNLRNRSLVTW